MKMTKLSSLGTLRNGINYNKASAKKGCKIIGVADFGNRVFPDYSTLAEIDASIVSEADLLKDGDILFVRSNGNKNLVGRTMYIQDITEPVCYSGFCIAFRPNEDLVYPKYLFYVLRSPFCKKQYSFSQQTNITNLSQEVLGVVDIPLPDLAIQKKLAEILWTLDCKIALNTDISSKLESTAKIFYDHWFVQFDFPDENSRPYRASGGKMVWNAQLKREIPKGWTTTTVGKTLAKIPNTTRILSSKYMNEGQFPVIDQSSEFIAGYTNDPEAILKSDSGYIVFGDHTRVVKYIRFPFARGADGTQVLKSNNPCIPEELFYQMVNSIDLSNYGYARHFKFLKDTLIMVPDKNISNEFVKIVRPIYEKQVGIVFENIELIKLRDWILPMLINGQARVE